VRYPHHYWLAGPRRILLLLGMMAGLGVLIRDQSDPDFRRLSWPLWGGLWVMLIIQFVGGDVLKVPWVFQLQMLRITYWIPFLYIVLLASRYHRHPIFAAAWLAMPALFLVTPLQATLLLLVTHAILLAASHLKLAWPAVSSRHWRAMLAVYACWLFGLVASRGIPVNVGLEHLYQDSWGKMCRWIQNNTPPQSVFLAPPDRETFRLLAQRAVIVDFKACPYREQDVQSWLRRMNDLTGTDLRSLSHRGFDLVDDIRDGYLGLSSQSVSGLVERYKSDYFLTSKPHEQLQLLHQEGDWRLYSFPERHQQPL
jgi:hypothetical protein